MKTLILFYPYGGNTRRIAQMIQQEIGGDLEKIETVKPYTGDYNSVVEQGQREVERGFMPDLKPLKVDIAAYDRIIIGSPVWWYTFAPAIKTFLYHNVLTGKSVYPFATNGGWIGHIFKDFEKDCRGAAVQKGLNIRFDESCLHTPEIEIKTWAKEILSYV